MEEEHGHALGAEHQRLAGIFADRYAPQMQCAPRAPAEVCSGNKALTFPYGVVT
jgi:hypothetical protein